MKFTVVSVGEESVHVWDGVSKLDKSTDPHTTEYFVGRDHGFLPGDVVHIQVKLQSRKEKENDRTS